MNITYLESSKNNDVKVVWSDQEVFKVTVSVNRLPDIEPDMSTTETMSNYFQQLRDNMKPIGLGMDGWSGSFKTLDEVYEKIKEIKEKGYRVDDDYKNIIQKAHERNDEIEKVKAKKERAKKYNDEKRKQVNEKKENEKESDLVKSKKPKIK